MTCRHYAVKLKLKPQNAEVFRHKSPPAEKCGKNLRREIFAENFFPLSREIRFGCQSVFSGGWGGAKKLWLMPSRHCWAVNGVNKNIPHSIGQLRSSSDRDTWFKSCHWKNGLILISMKFLFTKSIALIHRNQFIKNPNLQVTKCLAMKLRLVRSVKVWILPPNNEMACES